MALPRSVLKTVLLAAIGAVNPAKHAVNGVSTDFTMLSFGVTASVIPAAIETVLIGTTLRGYEVSGFTTSKLPFSSKNKSARPRN